MDIEEFAVLFLTWLFGILTCIVVWVSLINYCIVQAGFGDIADIAFTAAMTREVNIYQFTHFWWIWLFSFIGPIFVLIYNR